MTAEELLKLFDEDQNRIKNLGRPASSALRVHEAFQERPFLTISSAADSAVISKPTARKAIQHLADIDIVKEVTGKVRNKVFVYKECMNTLMRGGTSELSDAIIP